MKLIFGVWLLCGMFACNNPVATVRPPEPVSEEQLLQMHKKFSLDEQIEIDAFIHRLGCRLCCHLGCAPKKTESGLYISTLSANSAKSKIKQGDTVEMLVNIRLINGDRIFEGQHNIIMGKTEMIRGLREALPLLNYGDSAFLIIPSHLAYGFSGDGEAIPARATLLYNLTINKNKQ